MSTTHKHTPGPWQLGAGRTFTTTSGEFYITYGQDRHKNPLFRDFCELDANARLIAAAPELLGACLRLNRWAEQHPESATIQGIVSDARAAIAKATGRENG